MPRRTFALVLGSILVALHGTATEAQSVRVARAGASGVEREARASAPVFVSGFAGIEAAAPEVRKGRPFWRNGIIGFVVGAVVVGTASAGLTDAFCDAAPEHCRDNVREARIVGALSGGLAGAAVGALIACARSPGEKSGSDTTPENLRVVGRSPNASASSRVR